MPEISKPEFKRLLLARLLVWPPIFFDVKWYAWRIESEDNPEEFVWCSP